MICNNEVLNEGYRPGFREQGSFTDSNVSQSKHVE